MELLDNHQYFAGNKPLIIPHRGGVKVVPENTLEGLNFINDHKFSHFETDLRMSKDGEIFLHHDETFDRTTNVQVKLTNLTGKKFSKLMQDISFIKLEINQKNLHNLLD